MKALAAATLVIIALAIMSMVTVGFLFMRGFNPGAHQISREQAISQCRSWCTEDQQKIYQLHGRPGVLDLPNEKDGISFLKPTSFCQRKVNVIGIGDVYCDQVMTCKVTDGDGDVGYLHCSGGIQVQQGGSSGGGPSGHPPTINGPLAQGVPVRSKLLSCDRDSGQYIKMYVNNTNPLILGDIRVWGIVCNGNSPVVNQEVYLEWNKNPLADVLYYQNFDNITNDNKHNLDVLKGWNLTDTYYVTCSHYKDGYKTPLEWFWNDIGDSGVIISRGYLSPYHCEMYRHTPGYPTPMTMVNYFDVPNYAQKSDEVDMRIITSQGARFYGDKLTLGGTVTEFVFVVSNGTDTKYIHYVTKYSGCHPGQIYECNCKDKEVIKINNEYVNVYVTPENCSNLLNASYKEIGIFKNLNWENNFTYRNVTYPGNNSQNIFIIKYIKYWEYPTQFKFRSDANLDKNYTLKRVYFLQYSIGVGGCGGAVIQVDDFKILRYKDITKTNQYGMFNTTVKVPKLSGDYVLSVNTLHGIHTNGKINVVTRPYIKVNFTTKEDSENLTVYGNITYLNGTGVKDSSLWVLVNDMPYPNEKEITKYTFDDGVVPTNFKTMKTGPALEHKIEVDNGVLNVTSHCWWSGGITLYYELNNPEFINNVSMDILLMNKSSHEYNYSYYIGAIGEDGFKSEVAGYKYLSEHGRRITGSTFWPYSNATPVNLTLNEWHHISYNPLKYIGGAREGERRVIALHIGGYSSNKQTVHDMGFLIDNLTIVSVGRTQADKNGHFVIKIPKVWLQKQGNGPYKITILAYDQYGAEASITKEVSVS